MNASPDRVGCQSEQIALYLDGELDDKASVLLEDHLKECSCCAAEMTVQRQLLCAFDSALSQPSELPLPADFARIVAAHATSDMSGMRDRLEHKRALRYCGLLALVAIVLLGAASSRVVFGSGRAVVSRVSGVFDLAWTTIYNAVAGVAVVARVVSRTVFPDSYRSALVAFLLLALAVILLSRLIASYHRTRLID